MTMRKAKMWFKKAVWYILKGEVPTDESLETYEAFKDAYPKLRAYKCSAGSDAPIMGGARTMTSGGADYNPDLMGIDRTIVACWGDPDGENVSVMFAEHGRLLVTIDQDPESADAVIPLDALVALDDLDEFDYPGTLEEFLEHHHVAHKVLKGYSWEAPKETEELPEISIKAYEEFKAMYPTLRSHTRSVCTAGSVVACWGSPENDHVKIRFAGRHQLILRAVERGLPAVACFPPEELEEFLRRFHVIYKVLGVQEAPEDVAPKKTTVAPKKTKAEKKSEPKYECKSFKEIRGSKRQQHINGLPVPGQYYDA